MLNTAFANLPATRGSNCLPVANGDPQSVTANYSFTSGNGLVDQNANELWTVLVCKPWLDGELGTTQYATGPGRSRRPSSTSTAGSCCGRRRSRPTSSRSRTALVNAKQATYNGIAHAAAADQPGGVLAVPG